MVLVDLRVVMAADLKTRTTVPGSAMVATVANPVLAPLTLVILSLAGVAFASLVVRQRTKRMRFDLRSASEPTRLQLGDLRIGLAREQALAQRVRSRPIAGYWTLYRRATARDDSALQRIGTAMRALDPMREQRSTRSTRWSANGARSRPSTATDIDRRPNFSNK